MARRLAPLEGERMTLQLVGLISSWVESGRRVIDAVVRASQG